MDWRGPVEGRFMKHLLAPLAIHRPRTVYIAVALLTAACAFMLPRIHIDTDPENMLPVDQVDRVFHNAVKERFSLHDAIVVGVVNDTHPDGIYNIETLSALHSISSGILAIEGVVAPDMMSLAVADNITQGSAGEIRFEWMMKEPPASAAIAENIRDQVARLPLLVNTLVSGDGRAAAIYVPIERKDLSYPVSLEIQALANDAGGDDQFHITGLPVAEDTFGVEMFRQMAVSAPLAGLTIFLLMLYFFRSPRLVLAPMIVAMVTVIVTMGLLIGMGFTVHIMSSMIPIFLMPIAVVDSVHILSEFADHYDPDKDVKATIGRVIDHLYKPMLFTSVTTSIGFASLLITPIPPVQIFGAFVAFGVLLAFLVTIVFVPAYVVRMTPKSLAALGRLKAGSEADTPLARALRAAGRFAFGRGGIISGLAVVILAVSVVGVMQIRINDNPVRWFKDAHRIRVADQVLNAHFAGTYDAFLVLDYSDETAIRGFMERARGLLDDAQADGANVNSLRGFMDSEPGSFNFGGLIGATDDLLFDSDEGAESLEALMLLAETAQSRSKYFQDPSSLAVVERLQDALMRTGDVGKTNALPDVVKVVNRELFGGDAADYRVPATSPAVAQTLLQYQSSHRPQDLWHMVTPDFRSTVIWLQLKSGDNQDMSRVIADMDNYLLANPLPDGVVARWAGKTYINVVWQDDMVAGMLKSLGGAFIVVFLMMAVLFRSPSFGLLAMVPLTVTILATYGVIGWIGKDYDMPIAVLSSLTLGLSVDFAIHFIQRMRTLVAETGSFAAASREIFEEPARAIARNAIVIALGFTPLFFAALVPYITVGAFMASIMAISGLATLLLLPALMSLGANWLFGQSDRATPVNNPTVEDAGVSP
jgi:predicted RND superfamily exporter protein